MPPRATPASIGDGAARFDGATGWVLVADTLTGTITVSAFGDSLIGGASGIPDPPDRFSPNLETALEARGLDATVLNRRRRRRHLGRRVSRASATSSHDSPDVVILEFGTNDALDEIAHRGRSKPNLRAHHRASSRRADIERSC